VQHHTGKILATSMNSTVTGNRYDIYVVILWIQNRTDIGKRYKNYHATVLGLTDSLTATSLMRSETRRRNRTQCTFNNLFSTSKKPTDDTVPATHTRQRWNFYSKMF